MRDIFIEKLILNISVGESGDRLTFASRVLEQLVRLLPPARAWRLPHCVQLPRDTPLFAPILIALLSFVLVLQTEQKPVRSKGACAHA